MPMATMRRWRTKPPERIPRTKTNSPVERSGFLLAFTSAAVAGSVLQGIAVIGRNNRTTLVTSVQELLDRMKRKKFSIGASRLSDR